MSSSRYSRVPATAVDDASEQNDQTSNVQGPSRSGGFNITALLSPTQWREWLQGLLADDVNLTPAVSARRFLDDIKVRYSLPPSLPGFELCAVEEALQRSHRELKPLFIYIHSDLHEAAGDFLKHVLCSSAVSTFVNANFVAWGGSVHQADGFAAARRFGVEAFPYIGVYSPTQQSTELRPKLQRVWCNEDPYTTPTALLASLTAGCSSALTTLETIRADRQAQLNERQLREEQEREYKEAEERDRRRARERQEMQAKAAAEAAKAEEERELAQAIALSKELHKESVIIAARRRLEEFPEPAAGTPETALLRFTLPSGVKLQRRFASSNTLQTVRDYVIVATTDVGTPLHHFDLSTNYPKRTFTAASDNTQTLKGLGFTAQVLIFVTQTPEQVQQDVEDAKAESSA